MLPGSWLRAGDNLLTVRNRGLATEDWGLRLDGLRPFGSNLGQLTSVPAAQRLPDRVNFLVAPGASVSVLDYRCYDADSATEVARSLDGAAGGTCPAAANAWGADQRLALSANARHLVVFDNALNPPGTETWAVKLLTWLVDTDADRVPDSTDNCPDLANPDQADLDRDRLGDVCDPDIDGDGVANAQDAFPRDKNERLDTDRDGIGNNADRDDDNDGFPDALDPFPLDSGKVPPASIGVHRPSTGRFILDANGNRASGSGDRTVGPFGAGTDIAITGDWNGDGADDIGVLRPSTWRFYLDTNASRTWGTGDKSPIYGQKGDLPLVGDWNGNAKDEIGVYRPNTGRFYLDLDGSQTPTAADVPSGVFGTARDRPISGRW